MKVPHLLYQEFLKEFPGLTREDGEPVFEDPSHISVEELDYVASRKRVYEQLRIGSRTHTQDYRKYYLHCVEDVLVADFHWGEEVPQDIIDAEVAAFIDDGTLRVFKIPQGYIKLRRAQVREQMIEAARELINQFNAL